MSSDQVSFVCGCLHALFRMLDMVPKNNQTTSTSVQARWESEQHGLDALLHKAQLRLGCLHTMQGEGVEGETVEEVSKSLRGLIGLATKDRGSTILMQDFELQVGRPLALMRESDKRLTTRVRKHTTRQQRGVVVRIQSELKSILAKIAKVGLHNAHSSNPRTRAAAMFTLRVASSRMCGACGRGTPRCCQR
jgi:hypothetical protein